MIHPSEFPYHELSVEERLLLVEDIWDSIAAETLPLTDAQRREIGRRLTALKANPRSTLTWDEVKARIATLRDERRTKPHDARH